MHRILTSDEYRNSAMACPVCLKHDLNWHKPAVGTRHVTEVVECLSCNCSWENTYALTGYANLRIPVPEEERQGLLWEIALHHGLEPSALYTLADGLEAWLLNHPDIQEEMCTLWSRQCARRAQAAAEQGIARPTPLDADPPLDASYPSRTDD